jgi:hypothetical protein
MAAGLSVDPDRWRQEFDELMLRVGGRFSRVEPWRTILALLARAFLAVLAATRAGHGNPGDDQLIPLTCHEIRRLFTGLCQQPAAPRIQLHWSRWRRRHHYTARACHCRQRAGSGPYNVTVTTRSRVDGALS